MEIAWVNRHINSGKQNYESITKPGGKPFYNLMVLRNQGLEGMEALIDEIEAQARILREGHRALIESMTKTDVFLRRLTELNPRIIGAINASQNQSQTTALTSLKAKQPVGLNHDRELF